MIKIVDNYTLTEYLGKGEYGKVYKATNIETKIDVAVKMIPLSKFEEVSKLAQLTRNELHILKLLEDNINVINFVEMIKTNNHIYLVYEFCEGGTLEDLIRTHGHLPEKEALRIFKQLINAFRSIHSHHILHRDVKPNNIFFKSGHLKLADFGFCKQLKNFDDLTQTSLGSPLYMAPEILNGDVYGSKVDVWSAGIVLYEMLFGQSPFGNCNIKQLITLYGSDKLRVPMSNGDIYISPATENMLRKMLEKDQFKRISWEDFFYEYEIDEYGTILKKEKDFEYDLMKMMKKNSSPPVPKQLPTFKFDWAKITEPNSSVHSEELQYESRMEEGQIDAICTLKKRVKEFESGHEKRVELAALIEEMLGYDESSYHYSTVLCYFLTYNLQHLISSTLPELQQFMLSNKQQLRSCPAELNSLNKMVVVFRNEAETLTTKINTIKVSLISQSQQKPSFLKYPQQSVISQEVKKYLKEYEKKVPGSTNMISDEQVDRSQLIFLARVLWGISLIKKSGKKGREISVTGIKPESSNREIKGLINRLIVFIC